ncbi:hypothetical protein EIP91_000197 [Steccherinum ochraceum]|uniref:Uncharacterized protein n=1 Tax=Steccherinum ochraceum TaxID=92696 RepID=A0A4R0RUB1_9APHY|nr:hypothetical protein EIP91_000197 [Steccherinum ochraceum]
MLSLALAHLAVLTAVFASPVSLDRRGLSLERVPAIAPGNACDGFGAGAFDTAYNFTLSAFNSTLDLKGEQLVLGQAGAIDGASFAVLSTFKSYHYDDFPSLSLLQGGLKPDGDRPGSAGEVADGTEPGFIIEDNPPAPAPIYCGLASTSAHGGGTGNPQLAVNHDADSFSLCRTGTEATAQVNVVYKPTPDNFDKYIYDSCYPVKLEMVGLTD